MTAEEFESGEYGTGRDLFPAARKGLLMDNRFQGKTCPFCKTPFKEDDVIAVCSICETPLHLSCWQQNNGCATFGCTGWIKETVGSIPYNTAVAAASRTVTQTTQQRSWQESKQQTRRFETLFESEPNTIQGNVPVLIEKLSLIIDHLNKSLMARCFFRSLTDRPIKAMLVDVKCTDAWGNETESVEGFQFLDLKTKRESNFGQTKPIPIPDSATRSIEVIIKKVLYSDRTMADASVDVSALPKQKTLESFFGSAELANEYVRESNERARYSAVEGEHYWRCACGAINSNEDSVCYRCGAYKMQLLRLLNGKLISGRLEARKEEQRKKEQEQAARKAEELRQKKAKRKKMVKLTAVLCAAALMLAYAVFWHIIPYTRYNKACKLADGHAYDAAYEAFVDLGGYRDSAEKAIDTLYQKGAYLKDEGAYIDAASEFEKIPDYLDSAEQAVFCRNEAVFLEACALLAREDYAAAADRFLQIPDYRDSAEQAVYCQRESAYLRADTLFDELSYSAAAEAFEALGGYRDSEERAKDARYSQAQELFAAQEYAQAGEIFEALDEYHDSAQQAQLCRRYQSLTEMGYIGIFEECTMKREQAESFADLLSGFRSGEVRAAIFDGGDGVPLLWVATALSASDGYGSCTCVLKGGFDDNLYRWSGTGTEKNPWMTVLLRAGTEGIMVQIDKGDTSLKMYQLRNGATESAPFATCSWNHSGTSYYNGISIGRASSLYDFYRCADAEAEVLLEASSGYTDKLDLYGPWMEGHEMEALLRRYASAD